MSNSFQLRPTHLSRKIVQGASTPCGPLVTGLVIVIALYMLFPAYEP